MKEYIYHEIFLRFNNLFSTHDTSKKHVVYDLEHLIYVGWFIMLPRIDKVIQSTVSFKL